MIYLETRDGKIFETYVDIEDFDKVINFGHKWFTMYSKKINGYYAVATEYLGSVNGQSKSRTVYLHRFIFGLEEFIDVDHKDHKTLDNRKENLIIKNRSDNSDNRRGANSNNNTGHRNVSYIEKTNEYWVQICKNGVRYKKIFPADQFEEADKYAKQKRIELFGHEGNLALEEIKSNK